MNQWINLFTMARGAKRAFKPLLLGALVLFALVAMPPATEAQGGAALVVTAPKSADVGQPFDIKMVVRNAGDIAGYEAHLLFDPNAAEFSNIRQRQNDIKKQGRDIFPLVVAEQSDGASFGLVSCPFADCQRNQGQKQARGGQGNLQLATVTLTPQVAGQLVLQFDAVKFVDAQGNPVTAANSTPTLTVQVGTGGGTRAAPPSKWQLPSGPGTRRSSLDVTRDQQVSAADVADVALGWQTTHERGAPCGNLPDPALDLNQDNCIDVADVQIAAANATATATAQAATGALTWVVNTTNDAADATPGDGKCNATGGCTLRAAIDEANAHAGPDTINFNIPGSGVQTINLKTNLPTLSDTSGATTINGYSQPGASPNTSAQQDNAVIKIQLVGQGPTAFDAFRISSTGNVIRGLSIYNVRRPIYIYGAGATNNSIVGNLIGTNAAGTFVNSSSQVNANGVHIENGANANKIGAAALADRNVISGNSRSGVATYFEATDNNVIKNNIIGLSPLGDRQLRNLAHGIDINDDSANNTIGGTGANERNIISGNGDPASANYYAGVEISHGSGNAQNKIIGNCFGTDLSCNSGPSYATSSHYGVRLEDAVNNNEVAFNVIGNTRQGGINIDNYYTVSNKIHDNKIGIAANGSALPNPYFGIRVKYHAQRQMIGPNNIITNSPTGVIIEYLDEDFNTITRNSIYNNSSMGIDLGPSFGVSYNDAGDTDTGANQGLNYPVITSATTTQVKGTACGEAAVPKPCTIEIFKAAPNPSDRSGGQFGQGKTFVGSSSSNGSFTISVSGVSVGDFLTATATDAQGNTSEFSKNVKVTSTAPAPAPPGGGAQSSGWRSVSDPTASGGAYAASRQPGDTATFTFSGRNIKWVTHTGPKQGQARVMIDGVEAAVVDLYSASAAQLVKQFKGLGAGEHTIQIVVLGTKNPNSTAENVAIDAFIVGSKTSQETAPAIRYNQ